MPSVVTPARPNPPGFFGGARAFFHGLGYIVTTPSTWRYAIIPMLVAMVLLGGFGALGVWGAIALTHVILGSASGALATVGAWVLEVVLGAVSLLVAAVIALSLAQPISGFALEAIAVAQEKSLGGREWPSQPVAASFVRSLGVTLTGLALGLPFLGVLTLISVFVPPAAVVTVPLKFLVTALMIAWDLLDYPLSIRGMSVGGRLRFIGQNFGAVLGFGLASGMLLLVPGIGLLVLPVGVAGAARLVTEVDPALALGAGPNVPRL